MKKAITAFFIWLRAELRLLNASQQVVVVVAFTIMSLRVIFPVWHLQDGYVLYMYPFRESALCLQRNADCGVDRSRTAIEAGAIGLLALGVVMVIRGRR